MFTLTRTVCSRLTHVLAAWGDGIRDGRTIAQSYDALFLLALAVTKARSTVGTSPLITSWPGTTAWCAPTA